MDITSQAIGRVSGFEWEGVLYHISCHSMGLRIGRSIEISHLMLSEGSQDWIWMELDIPSHAIGRVSGWNGKELDITSHVIGMIMVWY